MEDMLKKYWKGKEIVKYNYSNLKKLGVLEQDANLLSKYGLPKSAAPYLNFEVDKVQEKEKDYYNIGFTGSGDFICLEKAAGRVVYLDHEEEDEKAVLINSSLTALLESIFCYRKFVDKVNETDMWNYLNNNYSIRQVHELEEELKKIDAAALEGNTFFAGELANRYLGVMERIGLLEWYEPAVEEEIVLAEKKIGHAIPKVYKLLLHVTDGAYVDDLALYSVEEIVEAYKQIGFEKCAPEYLSIGSNNGKTELLIKAEQDACQVAFLEVDFIGKQEPKEWFYFEEWLETGCKIEKE